MYHTLLNDRLISRWNFFSKAAMDGFCADRYYSADRCLRVWCSTARRSAEVLLSWATHGWPLRWDEPTCCRQTAPSTHLGALYCSSERLATMSAINKHWS